MAREQDGGALRQHARKEYARSIRLQRTMNLETAVSDLLPTENRAFSMA